MVYLLIYNLFGKLTSLMALKLIILSETTEKYVGEHGRVWQKSMAEPMNKLKFNYEDFLRKQTVFKIE